MRLKVAHFQCHCMSGDFDANLATVLRGIEQAVAERVDVLSFPESLLTGFFLDEERIRSTAISLDGPEFARLLAATRASPIMFMVGLGERRGDQIYNSVALCEAGAVVGVYSKAFCEQGYTPGRRFDVYEKNGVTFGIIICADGEYIEPARIQALKGARVIFAPHFNYVHPVVLIDHFLGVRNDHIARAVENRVWFLRGNCWRYGEDPTLPYQGVAYGDSYLLDPQGDVVARAGLHRETLMAAVIDTEQYFWRGSAPTSSRASARELGHLLIEAARRDDTDPK